MLRRILLVFALPVLVLSQNVTVTTQDPSMHFDGTWVVQDSGGHEFTTTIGSSVSLNFTGTAVYWHATINPICGIANVSVDDDAGVLVDASNGTNTNSTPIPAILFARSGLDPGRSHLINISFFALGELGGPYMEMYNLTYTQDNSASITNGSASSSTETSSSSNAHQRNTGTIAGGVVGGVCGVGLILCFVFFAFRRRLQSVDPLAIPYAGTRDVFTRKSYSPRVPPRPIVPTSPLSSSPTIDLEITPSETTNVSPPQSSMLPLTTPSRSESAPSESEDPPPPYSGRS